VTFTCSASTNFKHQKPRNLLVTYYLTSNHRYTNDHQSKPTTYLLPLLATDLELPSILHLTPQACPNPPTTYPSSMTPTELSDREPRTIQLISSLRMGFIRISFHQLYAFVSKVHEGNVHGNEKDCDAFVDVG
jgi:hypothetical protein